MNLQRGNGVESIKPAKPWTIIQYGAGVFLKEKIQKITTP